VPLDIDVTVLLNEKHEAEKRAKQLQDDLNKERGAHGSTKYELSETKEKLKQSLKAPPPTSTQLNVQTEWENEQKHKYMTTIKELNATIEALRASGPVTADPRVADLERQLLEAKKAPKSNSSKVLENHKDVVTKVKEDLRQICQDPRLTNMTLSEKTTIGDKAQDMINLLVDIDDGLPKEEKDDEDDEEEEQQPEPEPEPEQRNIISNTKKVIRKIKHKA
jgi:hypothetical protein